MCGSKDSVITLYISYETLGVCSNRLKRAKPRAAEDELSVDGTVIIISLVHDATQRQGPEEPCNKVKDEIAHQKECNPFHRGVIVGQTQVLIMIYHQ